MIKEKVSLKAYTNFKIGGAAKLFLETSDEQEVIDTIKKYAGEKVFILGGGTNLLVSDEGFDGLVIHYNNKKISQSDNNLTVGSGLSIADLNNYLIDHNLSGFEWSGGLPGSVGGAVFGNAGAFGGETKDNIQEVQSLDLRTLEIKTRENNECEFGYRTSIFKKELNQKEIILSITLKFNVGESLDIKHAIDDKIDYRKSHQPLEFPSAGSVFKNVPLEDLNDDIKARFQEKIKNDPFPLIPAAVFIADAGLVGFQIGGAKISEKHPNFVVNAGGATARDVKNLIKKIQNDVKNRYEIDLEQEIIEL